MEHGAWNMEHRIWSMEYGAWNMEHGFDYSISEAVLVPSANGGPCSISQWRSMFYQSATDDGPCSLFIPHIYSLFLHSIQRS